MSAAAIVALRVAVRERIVADVVLSQKIADVFDEPPSQAAQPSIAFGETQARDWSAALSPGVEIFLVLHVWAAQRGLTRALDIAQRVVRVLDEAPLAVEGHRLVDLRFVSLETRRDNGGRSARASLRFRAALEILA